jgi:hypothetical protein
MTSDGTIFINGKQLFADVEKETELNSGADFYISGRKVMIND